MVKRVGKDGEKENEKMVGGGSGGWLEDGSRGGILDGEEGSGEDGERRYGGGG